MPFQRHTAEAWGDTNRPRWTPLSAAVHRARQRRQTGTGTDNSGCVYTRGGLGRREPPRENCYWHVFAVGRSAGRPVGRPGGVWEGRETAGSTGTDMFAVGQQLPCVGVLQVVQ